MKLDPILTKACRLARSRKYEAAIRMLEPEVNRYYGSFHYYYILGSSCLYTGDFGGALTYFKLAHEVKSREPLAILGLAALFLQRGKMERAVDYYLDILEIDEKNRIATKALALIRKQAGDDTFESWIEAGKLPSLYPPIPFAGFSIKEILSGIAILLAVFFITFGILIKTGVISNPSHSRGTRQNTADFTLSTEDRMVPVETGGSYRYILTRVQALQNYDRALSLFTNYRDETARIDLNRILESNAAENLKNRARVIMSYMEEPGFDTFRRSDNISYTEANADPALYNEVHVIWRGRATNIVTADNGTSFDLLVGYDTRRNLEGIVPVIFSHAVALNSDHPLEVLGRIIPASPDGPIQLKGLAIHQSSRLER